ncbi:TIGR02680 family protein [Nocardioides sp. YIM 152315]|uniref:TIGR02680 family protein n=1 Tax=Nocardioides sp. YIM 152315 TaxID=3031760 RepID=UPI0023D9B64C|nr:TIGR02680 family protein [Nocardioides sp. YIM 152315]MDF1604062.1 TIGR02680 family protein [Nocardioides sp. YIM 152315]
MSIDLASRRADAPSERSHRFRLHRAGILNVWQYDEQEFTFADGRLLLRGANGAGKSKTLEMLLPFALDGDKARITASARHHTSLLWLMTDGYEGQARVGYIWLEFLRVLPDGSEQAFTCGVGIRASASARTATAWHFATDRRVGHDLSLEDDAGPLSRPRLEETLGPDHVFEKAAAYKEHVGRELFGLDVAQYDEVLRLLYWLRQPQVGEDIEPAKLADQLSQALPQVDEQAVRSAGDTFDELRTFGEQIERRAAAADTLEALAGAVAAYARAVAAHRARELSTALRAERRLRTDVRRAETRVGEAAQALESAGVALQQARDGLVGDEARLRALEAGPAARDQRRLSELADALERDQESFSRARERVERHARTQKAKEETLARRAGEIGDDVTAHAAAMRASVALEREVVATSFVVVPPVLDEAALEDAAGATRVAAAVDEATTTLEDARAAARGRAAAVTAVREAARDVDAARTRQHEDDRQAEQAERRWEESRARRIAAQQVAEAEEAALLTALGDWARAPEAPAVDLPDDLTAEALDVLPALARAAVRPGLERLREEEQRAATRRDNAVVDIETLSRERARVEAETEPAPPPPALGRTPRPDGRALWQLVDFADQLSEAERAGLEAALQGAGLLDGWVRPGGRLLDADQRDVVLSTPMAADEAGTLAEVLRLDLPADSGVDPNDVRRVLTAIRIDGSADATAGVALDGSWRLGPAHGRAAKARAQYVGATARALERERRLAALDQQLDEARAAHDGAVADIDRARSDIDALERWERALPSASALRDAWTGLQLVREAESRDDAANQAAQRLAQEARTATARAVTELDRLATGHGLPTEPDALAAVEQRIRQLLDGLGRLADAVPRLVRDLMRWADDHDEVRQGTEALAQEEQEAIAAERRAEETRIELQALRESVGSSVRELEEKVAAVKASRSAHHQRAKAAEQEQLEANTRHATTQAELRAGQGQLGEQMERRGDVVASFTALAVPPGLLAAATDDAELHDAVASLAALGPDDPIPTPLVRAVERLAALTTNDPVAARNEVYKVHREASTGPAADHQPAIAPYEEWDLLAVIGRDDAGEAAIGELARRVRASVERDRGLLTEREKKQFEQHVLGELGDAIRRCRRDATELVAAMNGLLGDVTTSQGIRVRLDWKLRDDVPSEARAAVDLLAQPVGALIPEEREKLRDVLHRLIEASRAERPELAYSEHLAAALDYRTWSAFTIRYSRPEKPGQWDRLHRRSALSQGEQKVLCYLPLFAAAAAHFTSLAGAAPHAPRLVLLDDAFPKIDVRTHPLLFGLLVQLDLDFVMTSERLWGDHSTVPSLAIYEALRDPTQRGIAQYEYRWDGRLLQGIG